MEVLYLQNKRRVIVQLAEDIAARTPDRVYAVVPRSENLADGFDEITYQQAINAVNYISRWLKAELGAQPDREFESLTYLGVSDLRYTLLTLACIKCGYKILLPSPRNSVAVNLSLMEQVNSTKIIFSSGLGSLLKSLASESPGLQSFPLPSFEDIMTGKAKPIPYDPPYEEALNHPVVILHSSGSTGPPKPIVFTNGSIATLGADWEFKVPEGRKIVGLPLFVSNGGECRYFGPMPPFHLGGLYYRTVAPIYSLAVPIYQPATRLPNAELVLEILQHQKVQAVVLPPSLIEGLLHVDGGLDCLKKLDWIMFSGGPLSQSAGDKVRKYTTLTPFYGSTELLAIRQVTPEPDNWSYHEFHADDHFRMEHFDDDVYELVALPDPKAGPGNPGSAAFMHSLPGTDVYHTKDLFKKHPERDLWQFFGRTDDILVLSSGEKINPGPFENELKSDAVIADALMVGSNRRQPALLVEPESEHCNAADLKDRVWAALKRVNASASGPSRVSRDLVLITDPDRLFTRTGKGSVVRKTTIATYEEDIADLYDKAEDGNSSRPNIDAEKCTKSQIRDLVRSNVDDIMVSSPPDDSSNLYLLGLDSLSTVDVIKSLARQIGKQPWLVPNILYTNPSIDRLASAVFDRIKGHSIDNAVSRTTRLRDIRARAMSGFASVTNGQSQSMTRQTGDKVPRLQGLRVAVTGTTGSLGSALVEALGRSPDVQQVICLNRSSKAEMQWEKRSSTSNASEPSRFKTANPVFYTVKFLRSDLGLSGNELRQVQSCDIIIHNAWRVDFNLDLSSFEDNLKGLRNLLELCAQAESSPNLVYVSSISSVSSLVNVPEQAIEDASACAPMGYCESKFVAERMLDQAAAESERMKATVLRIGQISGPRVAAKAPWPESEAFPRIMQTSRSLGLIPNNLPVIDWIPIDEVTQCILDLSIEGKPETGKIAYYNVVNPHQTEWRDLVGPLKEYCGGKAQAVSMRDWVDALAKFDYSDKQQLADKPALKVLDFINHLADSEAPSGRKVDMARAISQSPTLAAMKAIDQDDLRKWLADL